MALAASLASGIRIGQHFEQRRDGRRADAGQRVNGGMLQRQFAATRRSSSMPPASENCELAAVGG